MGGSHAGVVARHTLPEDERARDLPSTFFVLTERGWRTLNQHAVFLDRMDEMRRDHEVVEKSEKIQRYEAAPRPDLSPTDYCYVVTGSESD